MSLQETYTPGAVTPFNAVPVSTTDNTTTVTVQAAPGAGLRNRIVSVQLTNSSATDTEALLIQGTTTLSRVFVPKAGGREVVFPVPLICAVNAVFAFKATVAVTTLNCSAQGFSEVSLV